MVYSGQNDESRKLILVDFSCSSHYTHHASYLLAFAEFATINGCDVEIWINNAANEEVRTKLKNFNTFTILDSPDYGNTPQSSIFRFIRDKCISHLLNTCKRLLTEKFHENIKSIVAQMYFHKTIRRLKKEIGYGANPTLFFPSIDSIGLRFIDSCIQKKINIKCFIARTINTEARGTFGIPAPLKYYSKILHDVSNVPVYIGYETYSLYQEYIRELPKTYLKWAPIPSTKIKQSTFSNQILTIGFIGSARKNKGFGEIPRILKKLKEANVEFNAIVQLANFGWEKYEETLKLLSDYSDNIEYLSGGCSDQEFLVALEKIDVLIMPYDADQYKLAGSGILFLAADLSKPIFARAGVGFAWDIEEFEIGKTFTCIEGLIDMLRQFNNYSNYWNCNFQKYSESRNAAIKEILTIN